MIAISDGHEKSVGLVRELSDLSEMQSEQRDPAKVKLDIGK
jgi:hypothetical protein